MSAAEKEIYENKKSYKQMSLKVRNRPYLAICSLTYIQMFIRIYPYIFLFFLIVSVVVAAILTLF